MWRVKMLTICANHLKISRQKLQEHAGYEMSCVWHACHIFFFDGELKDERLCIRIGSIESEHLPFHCYFLLMMHMIKLEH
ncbi:hypothetical protein KSP40_PGU019762 [Platanthera guangdongensis]|uniref:RanBD1 domain-containing protein n=1 Tax=Platanthera guangdongensis TaxID=2320717 RepID=A0ABR2MLA2_9ASPA